METETETLGTSAGTHTLAIDLVRPAGVVSEEADELADIAPRRGESLAVVPRVDRCELVSAAFRQIGQLPHERTAGRARDF